MDSVVITDPIVIGLLSSATVSTILLIVAIYCHRNVIIPNTQHPVFEIRRPYFVSYVIINISIIMFLRSVIALLFYHSLISIAVFRESFRFLAIFGEMLCLIQRMYFIGYDVAQIKYKETKLLSKYLQRGNDTKQALNLMNQYAQRHIDQASPSVPTHSTSISKHLSLHKHGSFNRNNEDIEFDANSATLAEKILYHNEYFGNMKVMTLFICFLLAFVVFIPGFFVFYTTNIFLLCLITSYILFIIYMGHNPFNSNYSEHNCCSRMRHELHKQHLHLAHYDDRYIYLELSIILCIVCLLSIIFITIQSLKYLFYDEEIIEFYFILLHVLILTISGVFIVITLIFVPSFAIKALHKKYNEGKMQSKACRIDLKDVLSHYKSFYSFTNQLVHEYSIENLMFLIEIWQYKYYKGTKTIEPETELETLEKLKENLSNSLMKPAKPMTDEENKPKTKTTAAAAAELEGIAPLFKMKINVLLNALQDTDAQSECDESEHLKVDNEEEDDDHEDPYGDHSITDRDNIDSETSDDADVCNIGYNNPYLHREVSKQHEVYPYLEMLSDLPWHQLPLSDSYRKYSDRYSGAVHIFNKYLSRSAFDSLNISEVSLTDIECTLRSLYEYKLRSYNIGIEMDETERKQLKFESNVSSSAATFSRNTTNFDFFEEPEESVASAANIPPNIKINVDPPDVSSTASSANCAIDTDTNKEIKRKQKLRETLGLKIHFTSNSMYLNALNSPKIKNDDEFEEKLLSVFDICLPDIVNNLESALTQFRCTKEYFYLVSDKMNHDEDD